MARNISAASLEKLTTNLGTEPLNIIEIQWADGGPRIAYADRDIDTIKGRVLDIGGLDDVVNVSGGGQTQQISIALDDSDGSLKQILDTQDIHKRPCWVYQWFEGLDTAEKFLIFRGEINSPVTWNESDRTLTFDVISKIEDVEVGFSIEEGDFPAAAEELIGKPWPLCFGTVINVPALKTVSLREGTLASGVGIADFTLEHRLKLAKKLVCPYVESGTQKPLSPSSPPGTIFAFDEQCELNACLEREKLQLQFDEQKGYELPAIHVFGGDRFPQGEQITIVINGARFNGVFNGEVFTISSRLHPGMDTSTGLPRVAPLENTIASQCGKALATTQNNNVGVLAEFTPEEQKQILTSQGLASQPYPHVGFSLIRCLAYRHGVPFYAALAALAVLAACSTS